MPVRMWLGHRPVMRMLVVLIVDVAVLVLDCFVAVLMVVALSQMQPKSEAHQQTGDLELWCQGFTEQDQCEHGSDERSEREVCAGPRTAQVTQCQDEQH